MRKFLSKLFAFLGLQSIPLIFIAASFMAHYDEYVDDTASLFKRYQRHQSLEQEPRRILLVGDSNVVFGISAAQIEQRLKIPTTNVGYHAGSGAQFDVDNVLDVIRPGDVVILSWLAQNFNQQIDIPEQEVLNALMLTRPERFLRLNLAYTKKMLNDGEQGVGRMIRFGMVKGVDFVRYGPSAGPAPDKFNEQGDRNQHCTQPPPSSFAIVPVYRSTWLEQGDRHIETIQTAIQALEERGATVFYAFAPSIQEEWDRESEQVAGEILAALRSANPGHLLDTPTDQIYPRASFYDTQHHLTCEARSQRTDKIIQALQGKLNL